MKRFNESTTKYLIVSGLDEAELREYLVTENQVAIEENGEDAGFDVEVELKKLLVRKTMYEKDYDTTFNLRGHIEPITLQKRVWIGDDEIFASESTKIREHANEFNWGYGGSGPAQLSLAICIVLFGPDKAQGLYHDFKFKIIAGLKEKDFDITINIKTEGNTIKSTQVTQNVH